jgi:pyridoxal phosphate enzyme (YggS family)
VVLSAQQAVEHGLAAVRARIASAAALAERSPDTVTLVAISKQQPDDRIQAALALGLRTFGENRVQEALQRWSARRAVTPDLRLHLVGPLQTNKARDAAALFDVIESVDRLRLVDALADAVQREGRAPALLVQVNTGEEPQKAGVAPSGVDTLVQAMRARDGLAPRGLMCIPPAHEAPGPHFALLAGLARRLDLPIVSMGMSDDFEHAIRLGATQVRVGSALFGPRQAA